MKEIDGKLCEPIELLSVEVPEEYREMLMNEVLATDFTAGKIVNYAHDEIVKVEGENTTISLEKA